MRFAIGFTVLIVSIVAIVKFIQILNSIKRITAKAEHIAEKAEAVTEFFQRSAAPIALGKLIANMAETVFRRKNRRQGGKENGEG